MEYLADIRVFVIDQDQLYRAGFRLAVECDASTTVVGEAATVVEALRAIQQAPEKLDVVVVSVLNPAGCTAEIRSIAVEETVGGESRKRRVLVVSPSGDDGAVVAAMSAGAQGYVTRGLAGDELIYALHTVAAGGAVFGSSVADRLSTYFTTLHDFVGKVIFPSLSDRERQVLELISRGYDNRHIARQLVLSEKTVRNHATRLFRKLNVSNRMAAALLARSVGFGDFAAGIELKIARGR